MKAKRTIAFNFKSLTVNSVIVSYIFCLVSCNNGSTGSGHATPISSINAEFQQQSLLMGVDSPITLNASSTGNFKILQDEFDTNRFIVYNDEVSNSLAIDKVDYLGKTTRLVSNISATSATEIKAFITHSANGDRVIYVLYRSGNTEDFHVNSIDLDAAGGPVVTKIGDNHYGYAFQALSPQANGNTADFAMGDNGILYVGYIDQNNYPHVDVYDPNIKLFLAVNGKKYYRGLTQITDASEIKIAISPVDNLPVVLVSTKNNRRPLFIERYSSPNYTNILTNNTGISYKSEGDWVSYYGVTDGALAQELVNDINLVIDKNANVVIAYTSKESLNGHIIRLHNVQNVFNKLLSTTSNIPTDYELQDITPSIGVSQGGYSRNNLIADIYGANYYFSYSNMNPQSGYPVGTVFILRYNALNNSWDKVPENLGYATQASSKAKFSDIIFNPLTSIISLVIAEPNVSNLVLEETKFYRMGDASNSSDSNQLKSSSTPEIFNDNPVRKVFYTNTQYNGNLVAAASSAGLGTFSGPFAGYQAADALCANDLNNPSGKGNGKWHALLYKNPSLEPDLATNAYYVNNQGKPLSANIELDQNSPNNISWINSGGQTLNPYDGNQQLATYWTGFYDYDYGKSQQGPFQFGSSVSSCNVPPNNLQGFILSNLNSFSHGFMPLSTFNPQINCQEYGSTTTNYNEGARTVAYQSDPYLFSCNGWTTSSANWGGVFGDDSKYYKSTVEADLGVSASLAAFNNENAFKKSDSSCPSPVAVNNFKQFMTQNGTAVALSGLGAISAATITAGAINNKYTDKVQETLKSLKNKQKVFSLEREVKVLMHLRDKILEVNLILGADGLPDKYIMNDLLNYGLGDINTQLEGIQGRFDFSINNGHILSALNRDILTKSMEINGLEFGNMPSDSLTKSLNNHLQSINMVIDSRVPGWGDQVNSLTKDFFSGRAQSQSELKLFQQLVVMDSTKSTYDRFIKRYQDDVIGQSQLVETLKAEVQKIQSDIDKSYQKMKNLRQPGADYDYFFDNKNLPTIKVDSLLSDIKQFYPYSNFKEAELLQDEIRILRGLKSRMSSSLNYGSDLTAIIDEKIDTDISSQSLIDLSFSPNDVTREARTVSNSLKEIERRLSASRVTEDFEEQALLYVENYEDYLYKKMSLLQAEQEMSAYKFSISRLNSSISEISARQNDYIAIFGFGDPDEIMDLSTIAMSSSEFTRIERELANAERNLQQFAIQSNPDPATFEQAVNEYKQKQLELTNQIMKDNPMNGTSKQAIENMSQRTMELLDGGKLITALNAVTGFFDITALGFMAYALYLQVEDANAQLPTSCVSEQSGSGGVTVSHSWDYLNDGGNIPGWIQSWQQNHSKSGIAGEREWNLHTISFTSGQNAPTLPNDVQPQSNALGIMSGGQHFVYLNQTTGSICSLPQTIPGWSNSSSNPQCPASRYYNTLIPQYGSSINQQTTSGNINNLSTTKDLLVPVMASCATPKPLLCVGPY